MNVGNLGLLAALGVAIATIAYEFWKWNQERPHEHQSPPPSLLPPNPPRKRRNGRNTQKQKLIDELNSATAECPICTEIITPEIEIFSCVRCYAIYHLKCIKQWAMERLRGSGVYWTCPACNYKYYSNPNSLEYRCFCGKTRRPRSMAPFTPHCCAEQCPRLGCNDSCHPGPCDD